MIRPEFKKQLETQQKVLVKVWAAFLIATLFYLFIPQILLKWSQPLGDFPTAGLMRQILWLFALVEVGFLFWWKKRFLSKESLFQRPRRASFLPNIINGHQSSSEESAARVVSHYSLGTVGGFAIAESTAIYGLVLAYAGRYFWDQYVLSLICALMLVYFYPFKSSFDDLVRELDAENDE